MPACPASVASTVVPVWIEPNTTPMSSWAARSTTKAAVTSRAPACDSGRWAWVSRAVGCSAKAHPKTRRIDAAMTRASCGARDDDEEPEQGRAEDEGRLVGSALVGEGGLHEPGLVVLLLPGDRAPAHAGERADLRHRRHRRRAATVTTSRGRPRPGPGRRAREPEAAEHRLHEDDGPLPDAVGERLRRPVRRRHSPRRARRRRRPRGRTSRWSRRRGGGCPSGPWPAAGGRRRRRRRRGVRRG